MPVLPPTNPNIKKVTWLELFFDLIFALALAMASKPLEHVSDFSGSSFLSLGQFILVFMFLIMFWYRHMVLVNRFEHSSFFFAVLTLFIGFLIIAFTQFLTIWRLQPDLGSFLATLTISLATISVAALYYLSSFGIGSELASEKTWAKISARHMLWEALGYLAALIITPGLRPYAFIIVFLYFHRYPFETYINPKKVSTLHPALVNLPPEKADHKTERIGLFALLVYGLVIVLAATPLLQINSRSVAGILDPILNFGMVFFFISIIWYLQYRLIEIAKPKFNQFTVLTFIGLGLLVATTQFIRLMLEQPSNIGSILFAVSAGLLITTIAISFWNVKLMGGIATDTTLAAFTQWSYLLFAVATAFFVSTFFQSPVRETIWKFAIIPLVIVLLFDRRLNLYYSKSQDAKKIIRFFDNQTVAGITFLIIGGITFFIVNVLLRKSIASLWIMTWFVPAVVGLFILLNHWMHTRIKKN